MKKVWCYTQREWSSGMMRVWECILQDAGMAGSVEWVKSLRECEGEGLVVVVGEEELKECGKRGVGKWRGSFWRESGRDMFCTLSPADVVKKWEMRGVAVLDWKKAGLWARGEWKEVERELVVLTDLGFDGAVRELRELGKAKVLAFDIETSMGMVDCIAFAPSHGKAVCLPFWYQREEGYWSVEQEAKLWGEVRELLGNASVKIAQNGGFDRWYLENVGVGVVGLEWDTLAMANVLIPELPHDLGFLASIYSSKSYHKGMIKHEGARERHLYNALDACVTFEVYEGMRKDMEEEGLWEFYKNHSMPLLDPLYEMGRRGVDVDKKRLRLLKKVYKKGIRRGEEVLVKLAGREVNIKSPKQMKEWLYGAEGLGYKEKKKRVKGVVGGRVTCDEDAVRELLREHPEQRALQVVLKLREWEKISGTYLSMKLGEDGKARTTYNVAGTRTGRLSSGKTPEGEGGNFQNVPPWMRKLFLPAEGHVFVGADLSQAEARVVAYVSGDRKMMEFFEEGRDIHSFVAAMAWGLDEERVKKEHAGLRDVAKRIAHGANYGRSAEGVALEGIELGLARKCMTTYFMAFPGIQAWHRGVQRVLKTTRVLETPFGRKRTFAGRYSPDLLREAYAYVPQSTVGDITNRAVAVLWRQRWEVVFQIHDEVVLQCRLLEVEDAKRELKRALELPVEIGGRVVSIPATPKVADSWGGLK